MLGDTGIEALYHRTHRPLGPQYPPRHVRPGGTRETRDRPDWHARERPGHASHDVESLPGPVACTGVSGRTRHRLCVSLVPWKDGAAPRSGPGIGPARGGRDRDRGDAGGVSGPSDDPEDPNRDGQRWRSRGRGAGQQPCGARGQCHGVKPRDCGAPQQTAGTAQRSRAHRLPRGRAPSTAHKISLLHGGHRLGRYRRAPAPHAALRRGGTP